MNQDNSDFLVTKMARRALLKMPVQFPGIYSVLFIALWCRRRIENEV